MSRHFKCWLTAFVEHGSYTEASPRMLFWSGVGAIAGALRRRVWIDEGAFQWYPNFYILFGGPPGNGKSSAISMGMKMLRKVEGIKFGADDTTRAAMAESFANAAEEVLIPGTGEVMTISPLMFEAAEFGNLFDPHDPKLINFLIDLWDNRDSFKKETKTNGNDDIKGPCINLVAGTTPAGAEMLFSKGALGGGFLSRCVVVYQAKKHQRIAYPSRRKPKDLKEMRRKLEEDLVRISEVEPGELRLTEEAMDWGEKWYEEVCDQLEKDGMEGGLIQGYFGRKQTHVHKLAIVLAMSRGNEKVITKEILEEAAGIVTELEEEAGTVFAGVGKDGAGVVAAKTMEYLKAKGGVLGIQELYERVHSLMPKYKEFEEVVNGLVMSGQVICGMSGGKYEVKEIKKERKKDD